MRGNIERKFGGYSGVSDKVARVELDTGTLVMGAGAVSEVAIM